MSTRMLVWGLSAAIALATLLLAAALVIVVTAPLLGEPLLSTWSVALAASEPLALNASGPARLQLDHGTLALVGGGGWMRALKLLDIAVLGALALSALVLLRRQAIDIRNGRPFGDHAAMRLRRIGCLLIAWPLWQALSAGLGQVWLFANAERLPPDINLLHSLESGQAGALRVLVEADLGAAVAGLVLLVFARAFAHGTSQRRDLEEIV